MFIAPKIQIYYFQVEALYREQINKDFNLKSDRFSNEISPNELKIQLHEKNL
jgi:hypothetical protein